MLVTIFTAFISIDIWNAWPTTPTFHACKLYKTIEFLIDSIFSCYLDVSETKFVGENNFEAI